jgi:Nitrate and nitrite sensing/HAMP domain
MVRGASSVLSRARKSRGFPLAATGPRVPRDPNLFAAGDGAAGPGSSEPAALPPAHGGRPGGGQASLTALRHALGNLRVRSRLLLLVIIPTVTAVAAGGIFIASSVQSALVDQRVQTLANLSGKVTGLVQALQNERQDTVKFIVLGNANGGRGTTAASAIPSTQELGLLHQDYAVTVGWTSQVKPLAQGIGGSYSALAQQDAQAAVTEIANLPAIRATATSTSLPALIVINEYATVINSLLAIESQIAVGSGDSALAGSVQVLGLVSSMKEQASQQQALLTSALRSDLVALGQLGPSQQSALTNAQAQQQGDLNELNTAATPAQRQLFNNVLSNPNFVQAQAQEQAAISLASSKSPIATDPTISDASASLTYVVSGMRSAEQQFANSVLSRSNSLHSSAITSAVLYSLAVVLLLGIALGATALVGQSMVGPLRRLRNGALQVAEVRLPDMVRRMGEADGDSLPFTVEPIDVDSSDEIGEVARAFDQVHREALRLAANEAVLRGNVNAMFVNLSRRTQSLVERQIRVITGLEQGEQDTERLASLFQVDHLATRMRRNSENLLVLAGHELSKRWGQPVALVDVLRAAVSEIEQYERVTLIARPGISIRREAVRDVVHLTAELAENATSFSPTDTPVTVSVQLVSSGGALIDITDQGVGMRAQALEQANWRLENPPTVDVEVSRRMGLFVVARLAARHGIRVRLRPEPSGGLSALVWLPYEVITQEGESASSPLRSITGTAGNRATSMADKLSAGFRKTGLGAPLREAAQDAGTGREGTGPTLRPLPTRGQLGTADSDRHPLTASPGGNEEFRSTSGPLPRINGRMRAEELAAGDQAQDLGTAPRGGDQRTGSSPYPRADSGSVGWEHGGSPGWEQGKQPAPVTVPATGTSPADRVRLPIFEAVESDWFRGGGQAIVTLDKNDRGWSSPADEGWRAAEVVNSPTSDGTTTVGLPKRPPGANFVPGTAAAATLGKSASVPPSSPAPGRSATVIRNRFASYQRGLQQGRAAAANRKSTSESGTTT